MKYQTKLHEGLVPRQLHDVGKVIQVRNEEVFVYDSKLKKKKLNTPVKGKEHSHYVYVSILIKFSQETSVFTLIIISSP